MNNEKIYAMPMSAIFPLCMSPKLKRKEEAKKKSRRSSAGFADTAKRSWKNI